MKLFECSNGCENPLQNYSISLKDIINKRIECQQCGKVIPIQTFKQWDHLLATSAVDDSEGKIEKLETRVDFLESVIAYLLFERRK